MNKIDIIIDALEDRVKDYCTDSYDLDYYSCCSADLDAGHTTDCTLVKALDAALELREIMQQALTVLKDWDALIKYQYGGTSEAMSAMQHAAWRTLDTIEGLEKELAKLKDKNHAA